MRRFASIAALVAAFATAFASIAAAQEKADNANLNALLELLPDETLVVGVITKLSDLDADSQKLTAVLKLPVPSPLMMAKAMTGIQEGIADDRPAAVALVGKGELDSHDECGVFFLPTSNYEKLIATLSPQEKGDGITQVTVRGLNEVLVGHKAGYAIVVGVTETERKWLATVLKRPAGVSDQLAPFKTWAGSNEFSGLVTTRGIKFFSAGMQKFFKNVAMNLNGQNAESARTAFEVYDRLFAAAGRELKQVGLGMRFEPSGALRIVKRAWLVPGGEWAKVAGSVTATGKPPLAGLPAGPYVMAVDAALGGASSDWITNFSLSSMKQMAATQDTKVSDDDWNKIAAAMKQSMQGVQSMVFAMAVPEEGKSIYSGMTSLLRVTDSAAYLRNYEMAMTTYGKLLNSLNTPALGKYAIKSIDIDGTPAIQATVDISAMLKDLKTRTAAAPGSNMVLENMFGPDGQLTFYLAAADPKTVVMSWSDQETFKKLLAAVKQPDSGLAADAGIRSTVAMLQNNAQGYMFLSPRGLVQFGFAMAKLTVPLGNMRIPEFPETPPMGVSFRAYR